MSEKEDDLPIIYKHDRNEAESRYFFAHNPDDSIQKDNLLVAKDAFRAGFNACFRRLKNRVAP